MSINTLVGLVVAAAIVVAAVGVAVYKWAFNKRADLSDRDKK